MKWSKKGKKINHYGDRRKVIRFLIFPLTLNGQTRWLEFAAIEQFYMISGGFLSSWDDEAWVF